MANITIHFEGGKQALFELEANEKGVTEMGAGVVKVLAMAGQSRREVAVVAIAHLAYIEIEARDAAA